jgi:hypothetical protein
MGDFLSSALEHSPGHERTPGRFWWLELAATLLLGLAAVATGWAAYQSARWGGAQTFSLERAEEIRRLTVTTQNKAYLLRVIDVGMFISWAQAYSQKNESLQNFLMQRFRPPMKKAVQAWLATEPLKTPGAPPSPFAMKLYRLPEDGQVEQLQQQESEAVQRARSQNKTSDNYVLVTVAFAFVSLFSGLSSKFASPGIRTAVVAMAAVIFFGGVVALVLMPVAG